MQDCEESKMEQDNLALSPDVILVQNLHDLSDKKAPFDDEKRSPVKKFSMDGKSTSLFDYHQAHQAHLEEQIQPETPEEKILQIISEFNPQIFKKISLLQE
jgi:hypothetical protein